MASIVSSWQMVVGNPQIFLCFSKSNKKLNPLGNTAANTQLFIELLDDIDTIDAMAIKSCLRGGVGLSTFRKHVTKWLRDPRITSVLWAGCPSCVINLAPQDDKVTTEMCHLVKDQMLKMLSVGAIEWTGFAPPHKPHTTDSDSPRNKKSKQSHESVSTNQTFTQSPTTTATQSPPLTPPATITVEPDPESQQSPPVVTKIVDTSTQSMYNRHNPSPA